MPVSDAIWGNLLRDLSLEQLKTQLAFLSSQPEPPEKMVQMFETLIAEKQNQGLEQEKVRLQAQLSQFTSAVKEVIVLELGKLNNTLREQTMKRTFKISFSELGQPLFELKAKVKKATVANDLRSDDFSMRCHSNSELLLKLGMVRVEKHTETGKGTGRGRKSRLVLNGTWPLKKGAYTKDGEQVTNGKSVLSHMLKGTREDGLPVLDASTFPQVWERLQALKIEKGLPL